jgi:hypothetical protein
MVSSAAGEVNADVLLAGYRQRGELLVVVLNLQGGAVGHQSAVRQTNPQRRADLGAFGSKAVVVLFVARCAKVPGCSRGSRDTSG